MIVIMDSGLAANQVGYCRLGVQMTMSGKPDIFGAPE
jgi:hypothetical protein